MSREPERDGEEAVMGRDPLAEDDEILAETFYQRPASHKSRKAAAPEARAALVDAESVPSSSPRPAREPARRSVRRPKRRARRSARPNHYRIVSISLYNEDIEKIDQMVQDLKDSGMSKANRSALIRYAIDSVDISKMPRGY